MARVSRHAHITHSESGTSVFDPVLCELAYRWFCPLDGWVLDPFAGGAVRGIVAALTGRHYFGIDISKKQIEANRQQAKDLVLGSGAPMPQYVVGDSRNIPTFRTGTGFDFIFSCPPYGPLERYSDDKADLSALEYPAFRKDYADIINKACSRLKQDRFACFVVGEFRDKAGNFYNFCGDTIEAFRAAGLSYYNTAVLVQPIGNQRLRVGKSFSTSRKLGMCHANVLVFLKGDAKKATAACGAVEFGEIEEVEETA